jgi:hypothetical protein
MYETYKGKENGEMTIGRSIERNEKEIGRNEGRR